MRWSTRSWARRSKTKFSISLDWNKWFAWFPVCDEDYNWYWFEFVYRKYNLPHNVGGTSYYSYRGREK